MKIRLFSIITLAAVLFTSCLKDDIQNLQDQIDNLKTGSIASIDTQIANINKTIDALEQSQATMSSDLKALVGTEVTALKNYVNTELKNNEDWTRATFSTLAQFDSLCRVVARIPGGVSFEVEESMKKWVNEQLADYYTIAQTDAKLDSLVAVNAANDSTLFASVNEQKTALAKAKADLTSSYQSAIKEAIEKLDGVISQKLAKEISEAKAELQSQIDSIKERLNIAEGKIESLLKQIQSIVVVPDYSDGSVYIHDNEIVFDVTPVRVIKEIVGRKDKLSFFSIGFDRVLTKADDEESLEGAKPKADIYVTDVTVNTAGQLVVSIDSRNRQLGKAYNVSLSIQNGSTDKTSEIFLVNDLGFPKYDIDEAYIALSKAFVSTENGKSYIAPQVAFNMSSDDVMYGGSYFESIAQLNEFTYGRRNTVISDFFNDLYEGIIYTSKIIVDLSKYDEEKPSSENKLALAQEKAIRGYLYYLAVSYWKNPPFVDEEGNVMTNSRDEILTFCKDDLKDAVELFKENEIEVAPTEKALSKTTVSLFFAKTVLGKLYMLCGDYANARSYFKDVIDNGPYRLMDDYAQLFHKDGYGNDESIFDVKVPVMDGILEFGGWNSSRFVADPAEVYSGGIDSDGNIGVPQWFAEMFENDDCRKSVSIKHIDDVVYNMEYSESSLNDMSLEDKKASIKLGINSNGLKGQSFWLPMKTVSKKSDVCIDEFGNEYVIFNAIRLAEVYLDFAEASIQQGDQIASVECINKIRQRVGLFPVNPRSQSEVLACLNTEKALELWMEGGRQADIRRWKDESAIARMKKAGTQNTILYDKLSRTPKSSDKGIVWENGTKDKSRFYTVLTNQFSSGKVGYQDKHEYFPIPSSFLAKYPKVEQDPAWK